MTGPRFSLELRHPEQTQDWPYSKWDRATRPECLAIAKRHELLAKQEGFTFRLVDNKTGQTEEVSL